MIDIIILPTAVFNNLAIFMYNILLDMNLVFMLVSLRLPKAHFMVALSALRSHEVLYGRTKCFTVALSALRLPKARYACAAMLAKCPLRLCRYFG
jgi:hypothetical protein